jgi:hypothetical protein
MNIKTPNIFHKAVLSGGIKMKSVGLLIALIAAGILIMPAFSMQDHDKDHVNDCCCDQNACKVCHKLMAIEKAGCGSEMGPATDNAREQFCKLCMKSMMPHDNCFCKKPMMPHDGCGCKKSMMGCDGKDEKNCCEKSMMGCDGKEKQECGCEKSMMGCDGKDKQDSGSVLKIYFEGQDNQMPMVGDDLN